MQPNYERNHLCSDVIAVNARNYADKDAVVCGEKRLTWAELDRQTNQIANALRRHGFAKGDKVCMFMPNALESFTLFWGAIKAGCVIVPLNVMLSGEALARLINASDGRILFAHGSTRGLIDKVRAELKNISDGRFLLFGERAEGWAAAEPFLARGETTPPDIRINPEDSMTIIYTSGTTGTPKGIEHSHFGRLNYPYGFGAAFHVTRYSVAICATPIYASGTWITMLPALYAGGKIVLLEKFSPEAFLTAVEKERGTHSFMVPAMLIAILAQDQIKRDASSLRFLISAGQPLPDVTRAGLAERFPGVSLAEVYGMTEGFFTIALPEDWQAGRKGTVGKAGFLEDIRIVGDDGAELPTGEVGEIVAYGPGMMKGYYGRPDLTAETVWQDVLGRTFLRSGDLGRIDEDGFLFVMGRKKDMIKSGGLNIYAADIEDIVLAHPEAKEVAVVGIPHPKWGETPVAVVILHAGATVEAESLRAWANDQLAKYQRLAKVLFRGDMPRATYGKIQKQALREELNNLFL